MEVLRQRGERLLRPASQLQGEQVGERLVVQRALDVVVKGPNARPVLDFEPPRR